MQLPLNRSQSPRSCSAVNATAISIGPRKVDHSRSANAKDVNSLSQKTARSRDAKPATGAASATYAVKVDQALSLKDFTALLCYLKLPSVVVGVDHHELISCRRCAS